MILSSLNYAAVLIATLALFALGALWYGPFFGQTWAKELSLKMDKKVAMAPLLLQELITKFILVCALGYLVTVSGVTNWKEALELSAILGIGLIATIEFGKVIWEGRSKTAFAINASYGILASMMGALIYYSVAFFS